MEVPRDQQDSDAVNVVTAELSSQTMSGIMQGTPELYDIPARHARMGRPIGNIVLSSVLAASSFAGIVWSAPQLVDYYRPAEPSSAISIASPSQAPTLSPWQEQALMVEQARTSRAELAAEWAAELAKSPIQPVAPSTPTHITIHTPARSVDQLPEEARAVFPNGVSAVDIDVDLGLFDGTPTGESVPDPNDPTKTIPVIKADPPHDNRGYVWTGTGTQFGIDFSSIDKTRPVYDITTDLQKLIVPSDQAIEVYGHASSDPRINMPFQNMKDVVPGDTVSVQTETGTFTFRVVSRTPAAKNAADVPELNTPEVGSFQLIACIDDKDAGRSKQVVILSLQVVASATK